MGETSTFVDGFPAEPGDADYAAHVGIDADLRNCQALTGTPATMGLLYPTYFALKKKNASAWLAPALRRLVWLDGREPWNRYLRGLLKLLVSPSQPVPTEEHFLLLVQVGRGLVSGPGYCNVGTTIHTALAKRRAPLTPELIDALQEFVQHAVAINSHSESTFNIAWRLWCAEENRFDGEPCFSARVRAELRAMGAEENSAWDAFLALRGCWKTYRCGEEAEPGKLRATVQVIGREKFAAPWASWIDWIRANQPAELSAAGQELLQLFLYACADDPELKIDETLYKLCTVRWAGTALLPGNWLAALLLALATRPAQEAFACVELLIHRSDTRAYIDVHKLYGHLVAEISGDATVLAERAGVDGYDLACEADLYRQQAVIDRCLRDRSPGVSDQANGVVHNLWGADAMAPLLIRRRAEAEPEKYSRAVASRSRWLDETRKPPEVVAIRQTPLGEIALQRVDPYLLWRAELDGLQASLLKVAAAGENDLVVLIETDISSPTGRATDSLLDQVSEHVKKHGYSLALVSALERWRDAPYDSTMALAQRRQRIAWLLWQEDVAPIREDECWSQRIRQDLRRMKPEPRDAWLAMLETPLVANGPAPADAETLMALDFRDCIRDWFEPMRAGERLQLTVCGRDAMYNLMRCAPVCKDALVDEAVGWFAQAEWSNERDQTYAKTLLPTFFAALTERSEEAAYQAFETFRRKDKVEFHGKLFQLYGELCARLGHRPLLQEKAPKRESGPAMGLQLLLEQLGGEANARMENDRLVVNGRRDTYEINMGEWRILRRRDRKPIRLELDFKDRAYAWMRPMLDNQDISDPFKPNYARISLCARLLLHDDINAACIVVDSD